MPRLGIYEANYEGENAKIKPWDFWTYEERSHVLKESYRLTVLNSKDIKPYLSSARAELFANWGGVVGLVGGYQLMLKNTLFNHFYRMSPLRGNAVGAVFLGLTSLIWVNLNPVALEKEKQQVKALEVLYGKIGEGMCNYNTMLHRTATASSIDKDIQSLYNQRNCDQTGTFYAEEDHIQPLLPAQYIKGVPKKPVL